MTTEELLDASLDDLMSSTDRIIEIAGDPKYLCAYTNEVTHLLPTWSGDIAEKFLKHMRLKESVSQYS